MIAQTDQLIQINIEGFEETLFLGELSAAVMRVLWSTGDPMTSWRIWQRVCGDYGDRTLSTITSSLARLQKQGLVERTKRSRFYYHYRATMTADEFVSTRVQKVMNRFAELGYLYETEIESGRITH